MPRGIKEGRQDRNYKKKNISPPDPNYHTPMPSRGRWEESDQLLCLPETKSYPMVRLRGKFSVSFRILREKRKLVAGPGGPPENTSTDLRKLKRHLPKVVTQLGL